LYHRIAREMTEKPAHPFDIAQTVPFHRVTQDSHIHKEIVNNNSPFNIHMFVRRIWSLPLIKLSIKVECTFLCLYNYFGVFSLWR